MSDQSAQTPQEEQQQVNIDPQYMIQSLSQEINGLLQEAAGLREGNLTTRAYVMQLQNEIKQKDEAIEQLAARVVELEKKFEDTSPDTNNVTNIESVEKPHHNGRTTKKKVKPRA